MSRVPPSAGNRGSSAATGTSLRWQVLVQSLPLLGASFALTLLVLAAGGLLTQAAPAPADPTLACRHATISQMTPVAGEGQLCIRGDTVMPYMTVFYLNAGSLYTAWLVYFDRPSACVDRPCGMRDMVGPDPQGVAARMDGALARDDRRGAFTASFRDMRLSEGSQVSLMLVSHGPPSKLDNRVRARQLFGDGPFWLKGAPVGPAIGEDSGVVVAVAVFGHGSSKP